MEPKLRRNKEYKSNVSLFFDNYGKLYTLINGNYSEVSNYYYENYEDFDYTTEELEIVLRDMLNSTRKAIMDNQMEVSILIKQLGKVTELNDTIREADIL